MVEKLPGFVKVETPPVARGGLWAVFIFGLLWCSK